MAIKKICIHVSNDGIYFTPGSWRKAIRGNPNSVIISERCVFTDKNVFAKMLYESDKIDEIEYTIYTKWFDEFADETKCDGHIFMCYTTNML